MFRLCVPRVALSSFQCLLLSLRLSIVVLLLVLLSPAVHVHVGVRADYSLNCTTGLDSQGTMWSLGVDGGSTFSSSGLTFPGSGGAVLFTTVPSGSGVVPASLPWRVTLSGHITSGPQGYSVVNDPAAILYMNWANHDHTNIHNLFALTILSNGTFAPIMYTSQHTNIQNLIGTGGIPWQLDTPFVMNVDVMTSGVTLTLTNPDEPQAPFQTAQYTYVNGPPQDTAAVTSAQDLTLAIGDTSGKGIQATITTFTWAPRTTQLTTSATPEDDAGASGDPQFKGLQGQSFQVHGIPDEYFALISYPNMQLNSKFTYISAGSCTYNDTECWTHPGTYMSEFGVMFPDARIRVVAGSHAHGCSLFLNDKPLFHPALGSSSRVIAVEQAHFNITLIHQHDHVHVQTPLFTFTFVNSDMFFNLLVECHDQALLRAGRHVHLFRDTDTEAAYPKYYPHFPLSGLLGVTWRNARYGSSHSMFPGSVEQYLVQDGIWGTQFDYNQYTYNNKTNNNNNTTDID